MRLFTQDRRTLWVLLPALGLMLFASAARAGDNPGPTPPQTPWTGWVPGVGWTPNTPSAPTAPAPDAPDGLKNILRHTDIPGAPRASSVPPTQSGPGIPYLRDGAPEVPGIGTLPRAPSSPGAPNTPSLPQ